MRQRGGPSSDPPALSMGFDRSPIVASTCPSASTRPTQILFALYPRKVLLSRRNNASNSGRSRVLASTSSAQAPVQERTPQDTPHPVDPLFVDRTVGAASQPGNWSRIRSPIAEPLSREHRRPSIGVSNSTRSAERRMTRAIRITTVRAVQCRLSVMSGTMVLTNPAPMSSFGRCATGDGNARVRR
jgi:hypothetical protein